MIGAIVSALLLITPMAKPAARCEQWHGVAIQAGWKRQDLKMLDYIMWRESRCKPSQHNKTLNADGSTDIGLTQINDWSWCLPTRYYPKGVLQSVQLIDKCGELFNPLTNLKAALFIHSMYGFDPWGL